MLANLLQFALQRKQKHARDNVSPMPVCMFRFPFREVLVTR